MAPNRCRHLFWSTIDQNTGRKGHMVSIKWGSHGVTEAGEAAVGLVRTALSDLTL